MSEQERRREQQHTGGTRAASPFFLSTPTPNRYHSLCLEVKMESTLCHQQAGRQFHPHESGSQSAPEAMAATAAHGEFSCVGPHFLAFWATLRFSCQGRLFPAATSQLWVLLWLYTLLPRGFGAFLLPVLYGLLGLHTYHWTLGTQTTPQIKA